MPEPEPTGPTIYILRDRDYEYIVNRLYFNCDTEEAVERLKKLGRTEDADALMEILREYNDRLREFRLGFKRESPPRRNDG